MSSAQTFAVIHVQFISIYFVDGIQLKISFVLICLDHALLLLSGASFLCVCKILLNLLPALVPEKKR